MPKVSGDDGGTNSVAGTKTNIDVKIAGVVLKEPFASSPTQIHSRQNRTLEVERWRLLISLIWVTKSSRPTGGQTSHHFVKAATSARLVDTAGPSFVLESFKSTGVCATTAEVARLDVCAEIGEQGELS